MLRTIPNRRPSSRHSGRGSNSSGGRKAATSVSTSALRRIDRISTRCSRKQLIALQPDAIFAYTTPITAALQRESRTIPIVFAEVSDPVGSKFVASFSRPGGNLTGLQLYDQGITGKWAAMLKEIAPHVKRVALLVDPRTTPYDYFLRSAEATIPKLAMELAPRLVENAADIKRVIAAFAATPNSGLLVLPSGTTSLHRDLVVAFAAQYRVPSVYPFRFYVP